jgi:hypothetical protein
MDTTEREELDTSVEETESLIPHLDDFLAELEPSKEEDEVSKIMNGLLEAGDCELPIRQVWEAATDAGLSTPDLLTWAESSETCQVDYVNGLIRCASEESTEAEETEEDGSDNDLQGT